MLPEHLTRIPTVHKQSNRSLETSITLGKPARPTQTQNIATQREPNKSATSPALPDDDSDGSSPAGNQHTHPSKTGTCSALGRPVPELPQPCTQQLVTSP